MGIIYLGPTQQFYGAGSSGAKIALNFSSGTLLSYMTSLLNASSQSVNVGTSPRNYFIQGINWILSDCDCNYLPSGWSYGQYHTFQLSGLNSTDIADWNNNIAGHAIDVYLPLLNNNDNRMYPFYHFKISSAPICPNTGSLDMTSEYCILDDFIDWAFGNLSSPPSDYCDYLPKNLNQSYFNTTTYISTKDEFSWQTNNRGYFWFDTSSSGGDCTDKRTSSSTSEFLITLNGTNEFDVQESRSYNLLIQPDSQHTSGTITLNSSDELYSGFKEFIGGSCRMLDSVCCHDVGYIDIYGQVYVNGLYWTTQDLGLEEINIPHIAILNENNVLLLRARFDDECCCNPTGYTDSIEDLLNNYFGSSDLANAAKEQLQWFIIPTRIEWNGFARLTDFCCDDSDCTDIPSHEIDINYPESSGGGGGDVDISCICDGLTALRQTLSTKLDSLIEGQGIIAEAIDDIEVTVDNECICDNLEAIKGSIDDLELSVTNSPQINVQPCQPIVTNPVNNITVQPSQAEITVQPCQPIVTNPVNNITVQPCQPDITVQPCQPTIQNVINEGDITIDNEDLIEKLDELFKTDNDTITDIIKNKDMGSNIDVEVSPADDVNINRVYYTNQRNGDTSIND